MTLDNHLPDDDLVLFALQLLPEERMRTVITHVQNCQQCRSEIARLQGDLAAYSTTAEPHAPPITSRERFMRQVAREPRLTDLPAFDLKPTEAELRQQDLRQQELRQQEFRQPELRQPDKLTLTPPAEPASPVPDRRNNQPLEDRRQQPIEDRRQQPLQNRFKDIAEDRHEDRREDRREVRQEEPLTDRSEPSFSSRQSRSLSLDSHDDIEPAAPSRGPAEPVFATRHSRSMTRGTRRGDTENLEVYREDRRRPRRAPWVLAFTGWAVAIGCSFVAGLQLHQRQQMQGSMDAQQAQIGDMQQETARAEKAQTAISTLTSANAMQVALHGTPPAKPATATKGAPPPATPEALAAYLADRGALVFVATHLQAAPVGKTYELWLLPANGQSPIPAGTFKPDAQGSANIVLPHLPAGVLAKGFGVTIENDGGSATPTLPIIMS